LPEVRYDLTVNEEGVAPVLCDRCAGVATQRARRMMATGDLRDFPATVTLMAINIAITRAWYLAGAHLGLQHPRNSLNWGGNFGP